MTSDSSIVAPTSAGQVFGTVHVESNNDSVDGSCVAQPDQERIVTRSKHGISKQKNYTDGTIRYGFLASTGNQHLSIVH
jgi:hypothetical protein